MASSSPASLSSSSSEVYVGKRSSEPLLCITVTIVPSSDLLNGGVGDVFLAEDYVAAENGTCKEFYEEANTAVPLPSPASSSSPPTSPTPILSPSPPRDVLVTSCFPFLGCCICTAAEIGPRKISTNIVGLKTEQCFNIGLGAELTTEKATVLRWLLGETYEPENLGTASFLDGGRMDGCSTVLVEVGPRLSFTTAWSTNAVSICQSWAG